MTDLTFPNDLADRLQKEAERQNKSVAKIVEDMLDNQQTVAPSDNLSVDDPLLRIWEMAEEANLVFTEHNVSERSREILNYEFADYLMKRMRGDDVEG